MKTKLDLVKEFRRAFSLPISDVPCVPSVQQLLLHAKMIKEESNEIIDAINSGPGPLGTQVAILKIRDVSGDLYYFALGLAAESGVEVDEMGVWVGAGRVAHESSLNSIDYRIHEVHGWINEVCRDILVELLDTRALDMDGICHRLCVLALALDRIIGVPVSVSDSDFALIHAANMRKLWSLNQIADKLSQEEAQFAAHLQLGDTRGVRGGFEVTCQKLVYSGTEPGFVVSLNGKVQKPPGWQAAQLEGGAV